MPDTAFFALVLFALALVTVGGEARDKKFRQPLPYARNRRVR